MLLAAGWMDNSSGTMHLRRHPGQLGQAMTKTPGRLLLLRDDTGHSIHAERPQFFAGPISTSWPRSRWRSAASCAGRSHRPRRGVRSHPEGVRSTCSVQQCIARIIGNGDEFFVVAAGTRSVAAVIVASRRRGLLARSATTRYFIKTEADGEEPNNLASLPACWTPASRRGFTPMGSRRPITNHSRSSLQLESR